MKDEPKDSFFVGYLDTPAVLKRFYWPLVIVLVTFSTFLGYWLGSLQKSEVPAVWNLGTTTEMAGVLVLEPYPILHRPHPEDPQRIESVLLVNQGKHSARKSAADFDQKGVTVTGTLISRGGWSMLEVGSRSNFSLNDQVDTTAIVANLETVSLGKISLSGEIADSKCFLGVMKPGSGKIHKACAEVCLLGGIPSMLVSRGKDGNKYGYLLTQSDGSSASRRTAKNVAEPVRITGELERIGDLLFIRMGQNGVQRI